MPDLAAQLHAPARTTGPPGGETRKGDRSMKTDRGRARATRAEALVRRRSATKHDLSEDYPSVEEAMSVRREGAIAALLEALEDLDAIPAVRVRVRQVTLRHGVTFADLLAHARWRAGWDCSPGRVAWPQRRKAAAPA
jgi:hypothetical protein